MIKHSVSDHQIVRRRSGSVDICGDGDFIQPTSDKRWFESGSVASINLGSSMKIFNEDERMANFKRSHSRMRIFDEKSFLGRRASMIKMSLLGRRNTVA